MEKIQNEVNVICVTDVFGFYTYVYHFMVGTAMLAGFQVVRLQDE